MGYTIASHWTARLSSIHGSEYETYEEAMTAIRHALGMGAREPVAVRVDDGWQFYADQDDADADNEGQAPHKAIAVIRRG